jgi:hypothetical protein
MKAKAFEDFVDKSSGCWIWKGGLSARGYGLYKALMPDGQKKLVFAHRYAYEMRHQIKLTTDETLDHLCFETRCVNPDHLEPVSRRVNLDRAVANRTHCSNGHAIAEHGYYTYERRGPERTPVRTRRCRACRRDRQRGIPTKEQALLQEGDLDGTRDYEWLTIPDFCASINHVLSPSLVRRLAGDGEIESIKVGQRKWLIRSDALDLIVAKQREG